MRAKDLVGKNVVVKTKCLPLEVQETIKADCVLVARVVGYADDLLIIDGMGYGHRTPLTVDVIAKECKSYWYVLPENVETVLL